MVSDRFHPDCRCASRTDESSVSAARQWRQQHERAIIDEFFKLLAIPNISSDRSNIQRNADAIAELLEKRGIAVKQVAISGSNPVVFGEIRTPGATRTIGFYAHYDGQPLDPKEWASPPFTPSLRDGPVEDGGKVIAPPAAGTAFDTESRIYARGAADDKAPIIALLAAIDALRAAGLSTKSNIKFAFEGRKKPVHRTSRRFWPPTSRFLQPTSG